MPAPRRLARRGWRAASGSRRVLRFAGGDPVLNVARAEADAVGGDGDWGGEALGLHHLAPDRGPAEPGYVLDFRIRKQMFVQTARREKALVEGCRGKEAFFQGVSLRCGRPPFYACRCAK